VTDLGEVLRDRAELAGSSHEARMAGVRARVSATRRRRAAVGAVCVVLALVDIVHAVLPRTDRLPDPAVAPRSLPEYQSGTQLIAQSWGDLPPTGVTVRFVPKSLELWVFTQCDVGQDDRLLISTTVNGRSFAERNSCGGTSRVFDGEGLGIVPGQPSVLTLTVDGEQGPSEFDPPSVLPVPASGAFAVGIGEAVPVSEYPFPPRPETLATFVPHLPEPTVELRPDRADPLAHRDFTIEWPGRNRLLAQLNTPGRIRVLVDDVVDFSHWSYLAGSSLILPEDWKKTYGLDLHRGQPVKITVIPERVTGDWEVTLAPR
jgi:hypothetical protein